MSTIDITFKALIGLVAILMLTAYPASLIGRLLARDKASECQGPNPVGCLMTVIGAGLIVAICTKAI